MCRSFTLFNLRPNRTGSKILLPNKLTPQVIPSQRHQLLVLCRGGWLVVAAWQQRCEISHPQPDLHQIWRQLVVGMLNLIPLPPNFAAIGCRPLPPNLVATCSRFCTQIVKKLNPQLVNHHHQILLLKH
jgi:hypothetical protein